MVKKLSLTGRIQILFMELGKNILPVVLLRGLINNYKHRHLAEKWESSYLPPNKNRRVWDRQMTELGGIEHLILLDLLGAPQPTIRSYFIDTAWLFDSLISVERRLGDSDAFTYGEEKNMAPGKWTSFFRPRSSSIGFYGNVGDDHVPFLKRGVSILHLIAEPFPHVWHRLSVSCVHFS